MSNDYDDSDYSYLIEMMTPAQRARATADMAEGLARQRHSDYDEIVSNTQFSDGDLDKIGRAGDIGEAAYQVAMEKRQPKRTPLEKVLAGQKATTGSRK